MENQHALFHDRNRFTCMSFQGGDPPAEAKALHPAARWQITRRMSMAFQTVGSQMQLHLASNCLERCDDVFMLEAISSRCKTL